jgi:hypothetical protein
MKLLFDNLELLLRLAAIAQLSVAFLNVFLVRLMNWRRDLKGPCGALIKDRCLTACTCTVGSLSEIAAR